MKKLFCIASALLLVCGFTATLSAQEQSRAARIVAELHNPSSRQVLVASHRGDWRNWPENSVPAIESAINMGVDIIEIDIHRTSDGVLVVCHDRTINRTTDGKGKISEISSDSIARCFLKTGHNIKTEYRMPTLREVLVLCKDRAVVNIDKGYNYYDEALAIAEQVGVTEQLLIKGNKPVRTVAEKFASYPRNMMYMPIINLSKNGRELMQDYKQSGTTPLAYEVCWPVYTPEVKECMGYVLASGAKLWVNSLWSSLCDDLYDDRALTVGTEQVYGKIVEMGATIIQTDRPALLIGYLREKGLHE